MTTNRIKPAKNIWCRLIYPWLEPYFDRELGLVRSTLVRAHAGRCAECQHQLDKLERLRQALVRTADRAPDAPDAEKVWERISIWLPPERAVPGKSPRGFATALPGRLGRLFIPRWPAWAPVPVLAGLAIVAMVAVGVFWQGRESAPIAANAVIIDSIESQYSSVVIIPYQKSDDMTVIWLSEQTST